MASYVLFLWCHRTLGVRKDCGFCLSCSALTFWDIPTGLTSLISSHRLLGLCNNFAYVVMLSAAHDILSHQKVPEGNGTEPVGVQWRRRCMLVSMCKNGLVREEENNGKQQCCPFKRESHKKWKAMYQIHEICKSPCAKERGAWGSLHSTWWLCTKETLCKI